MQSTVPAKTKNTKKWRTTLFNENAQETKVLKDQEKGTERNLRKCCILLGGQATIVMPSMPPQPSIYLSCSPVHNFLELPLYSWRFRDCRKYLHSLQQR